MISVLALDRSDGWVFAREGDQIRLLRPPYRLAEAHVVPQTVVGRAVTQHGYAACSLELATWADVITFVRAEVAQQRKAEGRALPEEGVGREMLRFAPSSTVERFLDRIQHELLPRGELDAAERILLAIQAESPRLEESPALLRRTAQVLEEVRRRRAERLRTIVRDRDAERFPRLAKCGRLEASRRHGEQVARAGSMFVR